MRMLTAADPGQSPAAPARWTTNGQLCQFPFLHEGSLAYDCVVQSGTYQCKVSAATGACCVHCCLL